jgi:hypothetical protein
MNHGNILRDPLSGVYSHVYFQERPREEAERALALYRESLILRRQLEYRSGLTLCLEGVAAALGGGGQPQPATRLLGAAEALREALRAPRPQSERVEYDQSVARVRAQLDGTALESLWSLDRSLTLAEAAALALCEEKGSRAA